MVLKGKTAVVTGASDGIGKQIALKLAKEGVNLALVARTMSKLESVKNEIETIGGSRVNIYPCDLGVKDDLKNTADLIVKELSGIGILINCAGIWQKMGQLDQASIDEIGSVISVNLTSLVMFTNLLLPSLRKSSESAIINISSRSGYLAQAGQSVYGASKWGVTGFSEILKTDLKGTGVRVATVHQGRTATKLFEKANEPLDVSVATDPADLADVIVFMLSRPPKIWLHDVRVEY